MKNNALVYGLREYNDFRVVERDFLRLETYQTMTMNEDGEND